MTNLKKIGVSALAGSLVAISANAAEVSLSGGASVAIYQENSNNKTQFYNNDSITFTVSGTTEGGITVTNKIELDGSSAANGGTDNQSTTISYDGLGTITYGRHGSDSVIGGWESVAPTAYEEVWDVTETLASVANNVIGGKAGNGLWRYDSPSYSGAQFHASFDSTAETGSVSSYSDMGVSYSPEMVEGLSIGYAEGEYEETAGAYIDVQTTWVKYAYGPITVSYQESKEDAATAAASNESEEYGISYAISDNFSVSYGEHEYNDGTDSAANNQESTGISASYTMAGTTIAASFNETDNVDSTANVDSEGFEVAISFAF